MGGGKGQPEPPSKGGGEPHPGKGGKAGGRLSAPPNVTVTAPTPAVRQSEERRPGPAVELASFLAQHEDVARPTLDGPQPYCTSCERIEIRRDWVERGTCSVCRRPLSEAAQYAPA